MISRPSTHPCWTLSKSIKVLASVAALLCAAPAVHAQVTYTDTLFSDNFDAEPTEGNELTSGETTTNQSIGTTGQNGWITSDPDNVVLGVNGYVPAIPGYVGGLNYVGSYFAGNGYTDNDGAALGGFERNGYNSAVAADPNGNFDVLPGAQTSTLYHPFTVPATSTSYALNVDSTITSSSVLTNPNMTIRNPNTGAHDSFGYSFRNATGGVLFSINFIPSVTDPTTKDTITYTVGTGAPVVSAEGVTLNARYHFAITVNPVLDTFSLSYSASGVTSSPTDLTGVSLLLSGVAPLTVNQADATWTLASNTTANGGYTMAGSNTLVMDNYAVTSVDLVPEPSTYAMMGTGFVGLLGLMKLRRRQA